MSVYLIRLNDGTEVITEVVGFDGEDGVVKCENPLQLNYRMAYSQAAPSMSMSRFMPFAKEPIFEFKFEHITQITEARESVANYYRRTMDDYIVMLDIRIDEEMNKTAKREDDDMPSDGYTDLLEKLEFDGGPLH